MKSPLRDDGISNAAHFGTMSTSLKEDPVFNDYNLQAVADTPLRSQKNTTWFARWDHWFIWILQISILVSHSVILFGTPVFLQVYEQKTVNFDSSSSSLLA